MSDDDSGSKILKPGSIIRPFLSMETAVFIIQKLYGLKATNMKEYISYDDRNFFFKVEPGSEISNDHLDLSEICPDGYMLKVSNSLDSEDEEFFRAQNSLILHLASKDFVVPVPIKNVHGTYQSLESIEFAAPPDSWTANNVGDRPGGKHMVRALKFVPGKTLYAISPWTLDHFVQCGKFAAQVDSALKDFDHPGYKTRDSIWFLSSVPKLKDFVNAVKVDENRNLVLDIIDTFTDEVISIQDTLEKSVIHGDLNEQNLLMRLKDGTTDQYEVFSMIDFGDSQKNPLIYELALAIMYLMTNCTLIHPNLVGGHVLAGYLPHRKLPENEMEILRTCVAGRYAQSLILGAYSYEQDPSNDYVLTTSKTGWVTLRNFWEMPKEELYSKWNEIVESYA